MASDTDVSSAQSFDVGNFLNTLATTGLAVVAAKASPSQNTGQPNATVNPNLRANPVGNAVPGELALTGQNMAVVVAGVAALLGLIYLLRK